MKTDINLLIFIHEAATCEFPPLMGTYILFLTEFNPSHSLNALGRPPPPIYYVSLSGVNGLRDRSLFSGGGGGEG